MFSESICIFIYLFMTWFLCCKLDSCLTYEKKTSHEEGRYYYTKWQKGRDIWWDVVLLILFNFTYTIIWSCSLNFRPFGLFFHYTFFLQDVVPKYSTMCDVVWIDAEDPLFLLCTSGRTEKPKVFKFVIILNYFYFLIFFNESCRCTW